jgi:hypothetical protein
MHWWGEEKPETPRSNFCWLISKQSVLDSDAARQQINGESTEPVGSSWAWKMEFAYPTSPDQNDRLN